ncbi:MAG TPA: hypothetical protein VEJ89_01535 [Myxococcaceae bacterium]|jgi:hypothetical protein|nr:hypothetical protein [Myxococcaceae bacterium]
MRPVWPILALLASACPERGQTPGRAPSPAAGRSAPEAGSTRPWSAEEEACVDRWLAARRLDAFGSPQGTLYAGGTPLFDEATGERTSRQAYLAAHRPEALEACLAGRG